MGNCQAAEATTVVIQHPGGKVERLYWPTTAMEVMQSNPGFHVALVTLCVAERRPDAAGIVRFTRVRLLKPKDTLLLGQAYRLVTSQEVNKALRARKNDKTRRAEAEMSKKKEMQSGRDDRGGELINKDGRNGRKVDDAERRKKEQFQGPRKEGDRLRSETPTVRSRHWRPALQSISEIGS